MARGENAYYKRLIDDALAGDSNSYAILFVSTYQNLYQRAFYYTQNEYMTQDILTDTYIQAFSNLSSIPSPRSFRVWVRYLEERYILAQLCTIDEAKWKNVATLPSPTIKERRAMYGRRAPKMHLDIAGQLLEYLFFEAGIEPNNLPLDALEEYHHYRMNQLFIQRIALGVAVIFLLHTPLWFVTPDFSVVDTTDHGIVTYEVNTSRWVNVKSVTAQMSNQLVPVTQSDKHSYIVKPTANGELFIQVTYFNNMVSDQAFQVTGVDRQAPVVEDSHLKEGVVTLVLSDDNSGVDYDAISITALTGESLPVTPAMVEGKETISFPYEGGNVDIVIPDRAGNRLHLLLSN